MGLILDSSIFIGDERKQFNLLAFYTTHPQEIPYIAAITASELLHGVERAIPEHRLLRSQRIKQILTTIEVIDFDLAIARRYAAIWAILEAAGKQVAPRDLQIGVTALHLGFAVATTNTRHFEKIPGIRLIDTTPFLLKKASRTR